MPNTRTDLIQTLVDRKLYPKKKKTAQQLIPTQPVQPLVQQPVQMGALPKQRVKAETLTQPLITKIELPTKPLAKILFLKRTLGI